MDLMNLAKIIWHVGAAAIIIWLFINLKSASNSNKAENALPLKETDKNLEKTEIEIHGCWKVVKGPLIEVKKMEYVEHFGKSQVFELTFLDGETLNVINLDGYSYPEEGIIRIKCIKEPCRTRFYQVREITRL